MPRIDPKCVHNPCPDTNSILTVGAHHLVSYFASPHDLDILVRGVRLILRLARTEPLASLLDYEPSPDGVLDGEDIFWPGNADPDTVRTLRATPPAR